MSITSKFTILLNFLIVFHISQTQPGENLAAGTSTSTKIWETDEFGDLKEIFDSITDATERRKRKMDLQRAYNRGKATGIATGIAIGEQNVMESNFKPYFQCYAAKVKQDCEMAFDLFPVVKNHTSLPDPPDLPEFFEWLNETHDRWMYGDFLSIETTTDVPSAAPLTQSPLPLLQQEKEEVKSVPWTRLNTYYRQWYYIVKVEIKPDTPSFIYRIQLELYSFAKDRGYTRKNYDKVYRYFAAYVARSFIQMCAICHRQGRNVTEYGEAHPKKHFREVLLDLIPNWYFDEDQFIFLQILHSALSGLNSKNDRGRFQSVYIRNRYKPTKWLTQFSSSLNQRESPEVVIVPYVDPPTCTPWQLSEYGSTVLGTRPRVTYSQRLFGRTDASSETDHLLPYNDK